MSLKTLSTPADVALLAREGRPFVLEFTAQWCPGCKTMAPIVQEAARQFAGRVEIYEVDVDAAADLAVEFGISSIPAFVFIRDGREVGRMGPAPLRDLVRAMDRIAGEPEPKKGGC